MKTPHVVTRWYKHHYLQNIFYHLRKKFPNGSWIELDRDHLEKEDVISLPLEFVNVNSPFGKSNWVPFAFLPPTTLGAPAPQPRPCLSPVLPGPALTPLSSEMVFHLFPSSRSPKWTPHPMASPLCLALLSLFWDCIVSRSSKDSHSKQEVTTYT